MTAARKLASCPPWPRVWCGGPEEPKGAPALRIELDVVTKSEPNVRGFWAAANRKKKQDKALDAAMEEALVATPLPAEGPWCVRFTRIGKGTLDDDNLAIAFKRLRDRLCEMIGVKDNDPAIAFAYAQEKRKTAPGARLEVWGPSALEGWLADVARDA